MIFTCIEQNVLNDQVKVESEACVPFISLTQSVHLGAANARSDATAVSEVASYARPPFGTFHDKHKLYNLSGRLGVRLLAVSTNAR